MKRIAITGAAGMLGHELVPALAAYTVIGFDRTTCDITDAALTQKQIAEARPDVVIHLAAFTKVNECQRNPERAMAINATGSKNVAEASNAAGAKLVYISTDYVFDGEKREPYLETDPVAPVNVYGRSKAAGETYAAAVPGSLILRCGWLFGAGGRNFVAAIREQIAAGKPLRVVEDQIGTPIWTRHLARAIATLVGKDVVAQEASGVVHAAASGECSWHEFARAIVEIGGAGVEVEATQTDPTGTPRPAYSVLSDRRLRELGVGPLPHWRDGLREYLHADYHS